MRASAAIDKECGKLLDNDHLRIRAFYEALKEVSKTC